MLKNCIQGNSIKLPQLGVVEFIKSREIPDGFVVKQARIVRKASGYFVTFSLECDVNIPQPVAHGFPVGIDLGLDRFLATSEGKLVKRPKFLKTEHRKLKLLQRRLKNKKKGSNNRHKLNRKIARLHQRVADSRKDWQFKLAHEVALDAGMVFVEDIDFRIWAKGMFCKHTLDAGFGQFISILSWACWKQGVYFEKVNKDYTSQVCPNCDTHTGRKKLDDRVHSCPECGYTTHRDVAAAQVIRNRGLSCLAFRIGEPDGREPLSAEGRSVDIKEIACGGGLTGTGNSLVKSLRDRKKKA
jgi:putative transposase